jgi:SAM-dependent methyltransferase
MDWKIKKLAKSIKKGKILELGAGPMSYRSLFPGCEVISTDVTESKNIDEIADVTNLQFEDASFDYVLCLNVLEHVYDFQKALDEIYRVLKEDGTGIILTPFFYPIHDPPKDYYRFTEYAYRKLLGSFKEVNIERGVISSFWLLKRFVLFYLILAKK